MDAIQLDWGDYWVDMTPRRALFLQKMTAAAQAVRKVYGGRILFGVTAPWPSDAALMSNVDW